MTPGPLYEGVGLIFGIQANSVACKTAHSMLINQIGRFYGVYVFVVLEGGEKGFEMTNQIERETKSSRFVVKF